MVRKAYSYIRFSRPEQEEGDSLRRQIQLSEKYAEKHNLNLDNSLHLYDTGISAFRGANATIGKLASFVEAIDDGKVKSGSVLLVESLDRLSRTDVLSALRRFTEILDKGISIVTLTDEREWNSESIQDMGNLVYSIIIMSRSHEESLMKSNRLSAAWKEKRKLARETKVPMTKRIPSWIEMDAVTGDYKLIQSRAATVRRIFEMSRNGFGAFIIAKTLTDDTPAWGKTSSWQKSYVRKILTNRAVIGEYQCYRLEDGIRIAEGDPIKDYFPSVIDEGLFLASINASKGRRTYGSTSRGFKISNLFPRISKCGFCGSTMIYIDKGRRSAGPTLVCSTAHRGIGCTYLPWRYKDFEQSILAEFSKGEPSLKQWKFTLTCERKTLELEIERHVIYGIDLAEKIDKLTEILIEHDTNIESILSKISKLEGEKAKLKRQIDITEDRISEIDYELGKPLITEELEKLIEESKDSTEGRLRLRTKIAARVKRIDVWPFPEDDEENERKFEIFYKGINT